MAALCLTMGCGLIAKALPHLTDGLAWDRAVPVPSDMIARIALPRSEYLRAANALKSASSRDGEARIARAEAALLAGAPTLPQLLDIVRGVSRDPASARGWLLLAQATPDRAKAVKYFQQSMMLAPYDYALVEARAAEAARLWPDLDPATKAEALDEARLVWTEPMLREQIRLLLSTPAGVALVGRAFAQQPDEIREMNRWLVLSRVHPAS